MIKASSISKSFGAKPVLDGVSLVVNAGEVAGVVGPNGAGKTTLLRILAGEERADAGSVEIAHGLRVVYLRQGFAHETRAAGDVLPAAFGSAAARVEALAAQLASARGGPDLEREYDAALAAANARDADAVDDARRALGLRDIAPEQRLDALSGGEQTKLGLIDDRRIAARRAAARRADEQS